MVLRHSYESLPQTFYTVRTSCHKFPYTPHSANNRSLHPEPYALPHLRNCRIRPDLLRGTTKHRLRIPMLRSVCLKWLSGSFQEYLHNQRVLTGDTAAAENLMNLNPLLLVQIQNLSGSKCCCLNQGTINFFRTGGKRKSIDHSLQITVHIWCFIPIPPF